MSTELPAVPESCAQCPHLDRFHSTCSHPYRQLIMRELDGDYAHCPVFPSIRSEAMRDLEDRLD